MNEPNRFFQVINRINSLFIIIFFVIIAVVAIANFEPPFRRHRGIDVKNASEQDKSEKINFSYGHIGQIRGLPIQMLSVKIEGKGGKFSSGGYKDISFNVLFLSKEFKEARWLFPNNNFIISSFAQIPEKDDCQEQDMTRAVFYEVVKKDTNGDGKLSEDDLKVAALSKPDGTGYVEIVSDPRRIIEYKSVNQDTELAVLFERDGKILYQTFSLENFSKTSERIVTELSGKP